MHENITTVEVPLSDEMAEQWRLLHKAVGTDCGQIEITINPWRVRIVDLTGYRFEGSGRPS